MLSDILKELGIAQPEPEQPECPRKRRYDAAKQAVQATEQHQKMTYVMLGAAVMALMPEPEKYAGHREVLDFAIAYTHQPIEYWEALILEAVENGYLERDAAGTGLRITEQTQSAIAEMMVEKLFDTLIKAATKG